MLASFGACLFITWDVEDEDEPPCVAVDYFDDIQEMPSASYRMFF